VLLAADGTARLTDFGVAHLAARPRLTETGMVVGTIFYLSPEACLGEALDGRTDIWAFGVMLYEMLTGEPPFGGETFSAVYTSILTQPLPDLSQRQPDVPDALADLVHRMLEKDRAARLPSVRLAGAELEALAGPRRLRIEGWQVPSHERPQPAASRFATPTPPIEAPKHNLPIQPTPFVGREAELVELERLLSDPEIHLATVVGAGGMGKTRLALQAAEAELERFVDGVYFVSLASLLSTDALVPTIAEALSFSFYEGGTPRQQLLSYLRAKTMLLILDNCEHLLASSAGARDGDEAADLVAEILKTAPDVQLLITSRTRLNVQGEHLLHLSGMEFPDWETQEDALSPTSLTLRDASRYSAVKLFLQSARRVRPEFELLADDLQYVSCICRLVGGTPLGILLAAAWVEILSPAEIADEISRSLDFLETDLRDVPERQRSLRAVFDHSWSLLSEQERAVFQGLSVFRGGFTRQAAQAVTGASLRDLMTLANKSLLHREPTGRYKVHELLRQYAEEELNRSSDAGPRARDRHSVFYTAALERWGADLKGSRQQTALAEIAEDLDNARAAWDWAIRQRQVDRVWQALDGLARFYQWRGRFQEGEMLCHDAVDKLRPLVAESETTPLVKVRRALATLLTWQSVFGRWLGLLELSTQPTQEALSLLSESERVDRDTRLARAFVLLGMAEIDFFLGDRGGAKQLYEQSLKIYRALGDLWGEADASWHLGEVAWALGAYGEAGERLEESLALYRASGDQRGIAASLYLQGLVAVYQGQPDKAERLAHESLTIRRSLGDLAGTADGLVDLAAALLLAGRFEEASLLLEESVLIWHGLGADIGLSSTVQGFVEMHLGRWQWARTLGRTGLASNEKAGRLHHTGLALLTLGMLALAEGAPTKATPPVQRGIAIYREIGQRDELGAALAVLGHVECIQGRFREARQRIREAFRIGSEIQAIFPQLHALSAIAVALAMQGEEERAIELYALATRYPYVDNSRWFEDVAWRHIAAAAATLPPEVVDAAQERGRARDLWATAEELLAELEE
jgi:predicted ATPase